MPIRHVPPPRDPGLSPLTNSLTFTLVYAPFFRVPFGRVEKEPHLTASDAGGYCPQNFLKFFPRLSVHKLTWPGSLVENLPDDSPDCYFLI